jgi:hypothetical protein
VLLLARADDKVELVHLAIAAVDTRVRAATRGVEEHITRLLVNSLDPRVAERVTSLMNVSFP